MYFTVSDRSVYQNGKSTVSLAYGSPAEYRLDALALQVFPDLDIMLQTSLMRQLDISHVEGLLDSARSYSATLPSIDIMIDGEDYPTVSGMKSVGLIPYSGPLANKLIYGIPLEITHGGAVESSIAAKCETCLKVLRLADENRVSRLGLTLFDTVFDARMMTPESLYTALINTITEYLTHHEKLQRDILVFPGALPDRIVIPGKVSDYPHAD